MDFIPSGRSSSRLAFAYTIPIGVLLALTNQELFLNIIGELIIGYLLPGRPIAMMMFKTWTLITMAQALSFTSAFKLGHYMKIPPRPMFACQVVATIVSGTVQLGVQAWLFSNVEGFCSPTQKEGFICPSIATFGDAAIIVRYLIPQALVPIANITLAVGCHWPATNLLAWPTLLRTRILLLAWCNPSGYPVDIAKEVQERTPELPQLPARFHRNEHDGRRKTDKLHALGPHLHLIQLRHPSPPL